TWLAFVSLRPLRPLRSFSGGTRGAIPKNGLPVTVASSELEPGGEARDPCRQNAAVDAGRVEIGRPRRVDERVWCVRIEHVEHVKAGAELSAADAEILGHLDVEHVESRADLCAVRLDADVHRAQLVDRRAAVGILGAEEHRALSGGAFLRLQV